MKSDRTSKAKNEQRVELKYCEGCGGLGIRECGGGRVYCDDCTRKMAELPVSKTASRRPILPVANRSVLDDCADSQDADSKELDSDDTDEDDLDPIGNGSNDLDAMAYLPTSISAGGAA
jgi:hypothetical protein